MCARFLMRNVSSILDQNGFGLDDLLGIDWAADDIPATGEEANNAGDGSAIFLMSLVLNCFVPRLLFGRSGSWSSLTLRWVLGWRLLGIARWRSTTIGAGRWLLGRIAHGLSHRRSHWLAHHGSTTHHHIVGSSGGGCCCGSRLLLHHTRLLIHFIIF